MLLFTIGILLSWFRLLVLRGPDWPVVRPAFVSAVLVDVVLSFAVEGEIRVGGPVEERTLVEGVYEGLFVISSSVGGQRPVLLLYRLSSIRMRFPRRSAISWM